MRCVSGLHEWLSEDDARRCCNGYRRVLLLSEDAAGCVSGVIESTAYGWGWVRVADEVKSTEAKPCPTTR